MGGEVFSAADKLCAHGGVGAELGVVGGVASAGIFKPRVDETLDRVDASLEKFNSALTEFNSTLVAFTEALERFAVVTQRVDAVSGEMEGVAGRLAPLLGGLDVMTDPARLIPERVRRLGRSAPNPASPGSSPGPDRYAGRIN